MADDRPDDAAEAHLEQQVELVVEEQVGAVEDSVEEKARRAEQARAGAVDAAAGAQRAQA